MSSIDKKNRQIFENIRQTTNEGVEYWFARGLQRVLEYASWDKFKAVIQKAIKACANSQNSPSVHFSQVGN